MNTKEVFNAISILFDGNNLTEMENLYNYGEYICDLLDGDAKHTTSLLLHTGSEYYQVVAIVLSALNVLLNNNTDLDDLLQSLQEGDLLLVDGQRVKFLGVKDGSLCGLGFSVGKKYFCMETGNGSKTSCTLEQVKNHNISRYQGEAAGLGGKGIKSTLEERKKFICAFREFKDRSNVSTEINSSIAVIVDRDFAECVYKNVSIQYKNCTVSLSKLVTAAYVSDNDSYQLGNNPGKEEPVIKFYSKVSSCRDDIVEDKRHRFKTCIVCNGKDWVSNSEIHDIVDRKSLHIAMLLGRTHYTEYKKWLQDEQYKLYALVPEIVIKPEQTQKVIFNTRKEYPQELNIWASHQISSRTIDSELTFENVITVKQKLLKIKEESLPSETKDIFLMSAYFLLNLSRTSFFPSKYCDKAFDSHIIPWKISDKFRQLGEFIATLSGEMKDIATKVFDFVKDIISKLYDANPKGQYLLSKIQAHSVKYLISPKAYYRSLLELWLDELRIPSNIRPQLITPNELHSSAQNYRDILFSSPIIDNFFNPFAELNYSSGEVMCYSYEIFAERKLRKAALLGSRQIHDRNSLQYDFNTSFEEDKSFNNVEQDNNMEAVETYFDSEMEKMSKELQFQNARRYVSDSHASGDGTLRVEKIVGFASGAVGFFTKYYKAYVVRNDSIYEVGQEDLRVGDSIVFTKETENKDIVDSILKQLFETTLSNSDLHKQYLLSLYWKAKLKTYMAKENVNYREFAKQLNRAGCVKHEVTVRSWLYEESHIVGPFDQADYDAMDSIVHFEYSTEDIKKACDAIRSLRRRVLGLLAKAIIRRMASVEADPIWDSVLANAENLSQIEQISSIDSEEGEKYISLNLINKPIVL